MRDVSLISKTDRKFIADLPVDHCGIHDLNLCNTLICEEDPSFFLRHKIFLYPVDCPHCHSLGICQEQQYPAWSDPMTPRYYVLNALNTRTGETHLYQYDTDDGTYQYFIAPDQDDKTTSGLPIPGRLGEVINEHLVLFFANRHI